MLVMAEKYIFNLELLWGVHVFIHMMGDSPPPQHWGAPCTVIYVRAGALSAVYCGLMPR